MTESAEKETPDKTTVDMSTPPAEKIGAVVVVTFVALVVIVRIILEIVQ